MVPHKCLNVFRSELAVLNEDAHELVLADQVELTVSFHHRKHLLRQQKSQ